MLSLFAKKNTHKQLPTVYQSSWFIVQLELRPLQFFLWFKARHWNRKVLTSRHLGLYRQHSCSADLKFPIVSLFWKSRSVKWTWFYSETCSLRKPRRNCGKACSELSQVVTQSEAAVQNGMLMVPQNAMLYHVLFNCSSGYSNLFYRHSGIRQFETAMNLLRILLPNLYPHLVDPLVLDWQARSNSDLVFSHVHHQHVSDPIQGAAGHGETTADQIWWWLLASSGTAGLLSKWNNYHEISRAGDWFSEPKRKSAAHVICPVRVLSWNLPTLRPISKLEGALDYQGDLTGFEVWVQGIPGMMGMG